MRKSGPGAQKMYIIRAEMRRLADALFDFVERHDRTDPRITLEALKEARHLARLACDAQANTHTGHATVTALNQLQSRLHDRLRISAPATVDVTVEKPNGRDK